MMDFERHNLDAPENAAQQLADQPFLALPPGDPPAGGLHPRTRLLLSLVTVITVGVAIAVSSPWWYSPTQRLWASVFPPPPYRGTLIFIQDLNAIKALRASDGGVQWMKQGATESTNSIHVGDMLISYMTVGAGPALVGMRAADGQVRWHRQNPVGYAPPFLLPDGMYAFAWYPSLDTGGATAPLFEQFDTKTGAVIWSVTSNGFPLFSEQSFKDTVVLCNQQPDADGTNQIVFLTAVNPANGAQRWQTQPVTISLNQSANCTSSAQQVLLDIGEITTSTLLAYDRQTGLKKWSVNYVGALTANDDDTAYTTTWSINIVSTQPALLTARDLTTGQPRWQIAGQFTALVFGIPSASSAIFLAKTPTGVAGIDARSGTVIWHVDTASDDLQNWQAGLGDGDTVYYWDAGNVSALHATTGAVIWHNAVRQTPGALFIKKQQVYLESQNIGTQSTLTVLDAATGHMQWHADNVSQVVP